MIQIKNITVFLDLLKHNYNFMLRFLVADALGLEPNITITQGYRLKRHPHDLHGTDPVRAIDGGIKEIKDPQALADRINQHWTYDPDRPIMKCALYHARCPMCGTDHQADAYGATCMECNLDITDHWHIHFQVHPNTVFNG